MLILKNYQEKVLNHLKNYLELTTKKGSDVAFQEYTGRSYIKINQLSQLPYVCLRVPTGGGKTLIGCHSINLIQNHFLYSDISTVLWLVPTNKIKEQTLNALKDEGHPYRNAIESTIEGELNILDLQEALYTEKSKYENSTCIIVSTLAALRIEDKEGRKIYESNGYLMSHFSELTRNQIDELANNNDGSIDYSLANVLRLRRPVVIVDEAHNARTNLSFDSLARFNPSCIIEFTATPQEKHNPSNELYASNVLCSISAAELKAEGMIKLPIYLETQKNWKEIIQKSLAKRKHIEKIAIKEEKVTGEYIRPIILFQAQNNSTVKETITVDVIKKSLIDDFKVPEEEIAIATGDIKELEDIDLFDPNCLINYIITIQALREGWDCSFAYVLCSLADVNSTTAAEQLIGRILRLPSANFKEHKELNSAYAYVVSPRFHETLTALGNGLIEGGFNKYEAKSFIQPLTNQLSLNNFMNYSTEKISKSPDLNKLNSVLRNKLEYNPTNKEITFKGLFNEEEKEEVKDCFSNFEDKQVIDEIFKKHNSDNKIHNLTKDQKDKDKFEVPSLIVSDGEQLELFEEIHFLNVQWDISAYEAKLNPEDFIFEQKERNSGKISVQNGEVKVEQLEFIDSLHEQLSLLELSKNWSVSELVYWLDMNIPHYDISQPKFVVFLNKLVKFIKEEKNVSVDKLVAYRFNLRDEILKLINKYRKDARKKSYQFALNTLGIETSSELIASDLNFSFNPDIYPANYIYKGVYKFKKHYYDVVGELKSSGEEFDCAQYIDILSEVKYWVRNLERHPEHSFWLQTSTDKFYPDFVAKLEDGRILVVEYKGDFLITNDDS